MICDICVKEGARVHKASRTYGKGKDIFIIENIPVVTCPHCGECYLEAETLHEIERIKLHKMSFAEKRTVSIANFAAARNMSMTLRHPSFAFSVFIPHSLVSVSAC